MDHRISARDDRNADVLGTAGHLLWNALKK